MDRFNLKRILQYCFFWLAASAVVLLLVIGLKITNLSATTTIRGVYYFGHNSWAKNFWSTLDMAAVGKDFREIKKYGFNSIILVVPWEEFQKTTDPISYDQYRLDQLSEIIDIAKKHGLRVLLRASYLWSLEPSSDRRRFLELYNNESVYRAWLDYMGTIYKVVGGKTNLYLAFISWEDLWQPFIDFTSSRDVNDVGFSKSIGIEWKIPLRDSKDFAKVFDFADDQLINRYLIPAQKRFPNLSLEVRVDKDPIYEDGRIVEWYDHNKTYSLPNTTHVVAYFSPAIGANNVSDEASSDETMNRLKAIVESIKKETSNKIFIDQFNFFDNTPSFSSNTRVKYSEMNSFINSSLSYLHDQKIGYGIWTYKNYQENQLYNPNFREMLTGWRSIGSKPENGRVGLSPGDELSQQLKSRARNFCITGFSKEGGIITINMETPISLAKRLSTVCGTFNGSQDHITIKNSGTYDVVLLEVSAYSHIQEGLMFDLLGEPSKILDIISKWNTRD